MVATWDGDAGAMSLRAWRNLSEPTLAYIRQLFGRRTQSMETPQIIVTDDPSRASPHLVPVIEGDGIKSMIEIPVLSTPDRPLGFFSVAYTSEHQFDEAEQGLLAALADRAAAAINNAELYERAQQVASLEERQRLARELHDSVSQALYGIALGARTARAQLERDPRAAAEPVDYILSLAEVGMAEMRALIFELRPESLESEGLVAALQKQVAATQARYNLGISLDLCDEPDAPVALKETLYRITQEALHNIVKHARATHVSLSLADSGGTLTLTVRDDGIGFDPGSDFVGHLGLKSMRERAEASGGSLRVQSDPGTGSIVEAMVPVGPTAN
jgi:signal transduction histidine kinase